MISHAQQHLSAGEASPLSLPTKMTETGLLPTSTKNTRNRTTTLFTTTSWGPWTQTWIPTTLNTLTSPSISNNPSHSSCPADLAGTFLAPNLIVPLSKSSPSQVLGTSYIATFSSNTSTVFTFDIPPNYTNRTCSLIFTILAFLGTTGSLAVSSIAPVGGNTSYAQVSASAQKITDFMGVGSGFATVVSSQKCEGGSRKSYLFEATGGLELTYFQEITPANGAWITVC